MSRWSLHNPATAATYVFEMSPNEMTSPLLTHPVDLMLTGMDGQARSLRRYPTPKEWTFAGSIRTQEMHDALFAWSKIPNPVEVTDHLARTFTVLLTRFETTEKTPTPRRPWRFSYTMHALVLGGPQ